MIVRVPSESLQGVKKGDVVTVQRTGKVLEAVGKSAGWLCPSRFADCITADRPLPALSRMP